MEYVFFIFYGIVVGFVASTLYIQMNQKWIQHALIIEQGGSIAGLALLSEQLGIKESLINLFSVHLLSMVITALQLPLHCTGLL